MIAWGSAPRKLKEQPATRIARSGHLDHSRQVQEALDAWRCAAPSTHLAEPPPGVCFEDQFAPLTGPHAGGRAALQTGIDPGRRITRLEDYPGGRQRYPRLSLA